MTNTQETTLPGLLDAYADECFNDGSEHCVFPSARTIKAKEVLLAALAAQQAGDAFGWAFQHEETGLTTAIVNDGINDLETFQRLNPRHRLIATLYTRPVPAEQAANEAVAALRWIMSYAERCKEPCGDDPESPAAIRNGKFASIALVAAQGLGMVRGPSLSAPAEQASSDWCPKCGCGSDRAGYGHLPKCINGKAEQPAQGVPAGWRITKPEFQRRKGDCWEIYSPDGGGGLVSRESVKDYIVRGLLDALAASPAPAAISAGSVASASLSDPATSLPDQQPSVPEGYVVERGFEYKNGVNTPTVIIGFPNDWDARDRFMTSLAAAPAPEVSNG